ncbi:hypothetical protein JCGZ_20041 [Jatropha curcas]|uniref:Uncharacterized protein n=1 Tax=Jatropha curcas TaxID=180498 RepID=A0A067L7D4_JATCU|nr:hypothetical protein JCGZ_20041 [Jatropha curcas]
MAVNYIVPEFLADNNYQNWSACIKNYLIATDLWDVIEETNEPPSREEAEAEFKAWRKKNAAALHAIQISCTFEKLSQIGETDSAKVCWETLAKMHEKKESVNQDPAGKEDPYKRFLPLCRVIEKGDLNGVKGFLKSHPDAINKKIALGGLTALHLATISDKVKIVKELVNSMSVEDLQIQDDRNTTAFFIAVSNGCMRTVDLLLKKNNNLVTEPVVAELPVITACEKGFRELTRLLYSKTPFELLLPENGTFGALLLHSSFFNKMFGKNISSFIFFAKEYHFK